MTEKTEQKEPGPGGSHYQGQGVLDFIIAQGWTGFHKGNIVKYLCRYQDKGGLEDLEKAQFYLGQLIEIEKERELEMTHAFSGGGDF